MFNPNEALHDHPVRATAVVSDGGWYATGHGSYKMTEANWRRVEADMNRRERNRLVRNGTITPVNRIRPQLLVRDTNGDWTPEVRRH